MAEKTDYDLFPKAQTYKIVRTFDRPRHRAVIRRGLTLTQAKEHLKRASASSTTDLSPFGQRLLARNGHWVDTYEPEIEPSWLRDELRKRGFDV